MDLEGIDSADSLRLLQLVIGKTRFDPSSGARCGVPAVLGTCSSPGCKANVGFQATAQTCPLHSAAGLTWQDKHAAPFCSNCYLVFPLVHVADPRHHCHVCGKIFCGDCSDYELLVPSPIGTQQHKSLWGAVTSRSDRCCIRCSSLLHPSQYKRVSYDPIYHVTAHVPIDICFIFDGTASMRPHIDLVEREIQAIARDVRSHHYTDCHFMAATYRDHAYGPRLCNTIAPMRHEHHFERLIKHVHAFGAQGNDVPEAVQVGYALAQAGCGGNWRPWAAKVVIHFADAPPHGMYPQPGGDSYPQGDPTGLDLFAMVRSLQRDGIPVYTIGVEPGSGQTGADQVLKSVAQQGLGAYVPLTEARHNDLHHFVAACICDVIMKAVVAQELDLYARSNGKSMQTLSPAEKAAVGQRVVLRLRTRTMPRFTFNTPPQPGAVNTVTGVSRSYLDDAGLNAYVDGVAAAPPKFVPVNVGGTGGGPTTAAYTQPPPGQAPAPVTAPITFAPPPIPQGYPGAGAAPVPSAAVQGVPQQGYPLQQQQGYPPQQQQGYPPQQQQGYPLQQQQGYPPQQQQGYPLQQQQGYPLQQQQGYSPQQGYGVPPQQGYAPQQQQQGYPPQQGYGVPPQQGYVPQQQVGSIPGTQQTPLAAQGQQLLRQGFS